MEIMSDLISRGAAIEALGERPYNWTDSDSEIAEVCAWESHKSAIENIPAVDAVPVVRCKYCKHRPVDHRGEYNEVTGFAIEFSDDRCPCKCEDGWYNWYPQDDWFCPNGERRDDDA